MWILEERTCLVHKRAEELRQKEWRRKQAFFGTAVTAVCLILVVGISLPVTEMMKMISITGIPHTSGVAGIIGSQVRSGHIVIDIFSFSFGVSLAVLLYRLYLRNKRKHQNSTKSTK